MVLSTFIGEAMSAGVGRRMRMFGCFLESSLELVGCSGGRVFRKSCALGTRVTADSGTAIEEEVCAGTIWLGAFGIGWLSPKEVASFAGAGVPTIVVAR